MVPVERIELPTFGLQNRCSTAELNRHNYLDQGLAANRNRTSWQRWPQVGPNVLSVG